MYLSKAQEKHNFQITELEAFHFFTLEYFSVTLGTLTILTTSNKTNLRGFVCFVF